VPDLTAYTESRQRWFSLMVILMSPFMAYVDIFVVTVANPNIQHGLHASSEEIAMKVLCLCSNIFRSDDLWLYQVISSLYLKQ